MINILSAYGIPRDQAMPHLGELYGRAIRYVARDMAISPEEREDLKRLRYVLDLDDTVALDVESTVLREILRKALKRALE